jgi:DNA-binding LacI/PurR family transcriptional regulator
VISAAGSFLRRAATGAVAALPAQSGGGRGDVCVAVAVRDDVRPTDQPFVDELLLGIAPVLGAASCRLVQLYGHTDDAFWTLADYIRKWRLSGMILVSVHDGDPLPELLHSAGFPVVTVGRTAVPQIPLVDADNHGGAVAAVEHLLARGHRRIGTLTGPLGQGAMVDRLAGYHDALAAAGIAADPALVVDGDGTRESGRTRMADLLGRVRDLDAVLVASDIMTAGALETLDRRGVRVPADLAVIGFDDGEVARSHGLTVVAQPIDELGAAAARLMLRAMTAGPGGGRDVAVEAPAKPVRLPMQLVVRGSS